MVKSTEADVCRREVEAVAGQLGLDLYRLLEQRQRRGVVIGIHRSAGHQSVSLGVAVIHRQHPFGERRHLVEPSLLGEDPGHRDQGRRVVRIISKKVVEQHLGLLGPPRFSIAGGQHLLGLRDPGILPEHDLQDLRTLLVILPEHQGRCPEDRLEEVDLVLGVGKVCPFGRGGGTADVAQGGEHAEGLLVEVGLLDLRSAGLDLETEVFENRPQLLGNIGKTSEEVSRLRRIVCRGRRAPPVAPRCTCAPPCARCRARSSRTGGGPTSTPSRRTRGPRHRARASAAPGTRRGAVPAARRPPGREWSA